MGSFLDDIASSVKDEYLNLASKNTGAAEFSGYVDTGCYILNALLSGSIFGGLPNNKISAIAGESSTGKSFLALGIVKHFLESDKNAGVVYFDTEAAITKKMMEERGIDVKRVLLAEPDTIQKFRTQAIKILDAYEKGTKKPPMLMVLDSLGMLSSAKEMEDTSEGKDTRDMTKAQLIRATFRVLTLKLAKSKVPLIVTGHTYKAVGAYVPTDVMSGGGGLQYAASSILMLSKSKDRDGTEVVGNLIKARVAKSRLSKENSMAIMKLSYKTGLDRYFGLLALAEKYGIIKKGARQYELDDGRKVFGRVINENPAEVFTPELLQRLDEVARKEYQYGSGDDEKEAVDGTNDSPDADATPRKARDGRGTKTARRVQRNG